MEKQSLEFLERTNRNECEHIILINGLRTHQDSICRVNFSTCGVQVGRTLFGQDKWLIEFDLRREPCLLS